jgi:hypothetical protein
MQTGSTAPTGEQLQEAFHQVPGLTAMDGTILGRDACGVLVSGFDLEQAAALQSGLAAQGVETEVVDESILLPLPPPRQLTKVEMRPEALIIDNLMGRNFSMDWNSILIIAAGRTRLTEFKRDEVKRVTRHSTRHGLRETVVKENVTREEQNDHLLLEIITREAALRYQAVADQSEAFLLFQYLGQRRQNQPAANLCLTVRDLCQFATAAIVNHGAYCMREDGDASFWYPSKTAFYREISWLLWMVSTGRVS